MTATLFLQLGVLLILARILGSGAKLLGMPSLVGELLAGVLLGPTLLGMKVNLPLESISWIGLTFLMVQTGLHTNLGLVRQLGRPVLTTSAMGVAVPFASGILLSYFMPDRFYPTNDRLVTILFVCTALSITAMPVIAKILFDLKLLQSRVGTVTLAAAIADDATGWTLLALIAGLAHYGSFQPPILIRSAAILVGFLLVSHFMIAPLVRLFFRRMQAAESLWILGFIFLLAAAAEALDLHAVFGAFVAGLILRTCAISTETIQRFEDLSITIFAPLAFAVVGLKVDLMQIQGWGWALLMLAIAVAGKVIGGGLGALAGRMSLRESLAVGSGMSARGAMELIVAAVGISLGVIGQELYSIFVLIAVATSLIAPVMIRCFIRREVEIVTPPPLFMGQPERQFPTKV